MLRERVLRSPHKATERACRDSAPGWRRSSAVGVSRPLRRTKRTSKPFRLRRIRNDRKGPWSVFFIELLFRRAARLLTNPADGVAFDGHLPAARAEPRLEALAPALSGPQARHAPAALGAASSVCGPLEFSPGVSGALGFASSLDAVCAKTSFGRRPSAPAFDAHPSRSALGRPAPVSFALISASLLRVLMGHGFLRMSFV